jgi:hypothetical protein
MGLFSLGPDWLYEAIGITAAIALAIRIVRDLTAERRRRQLNS